MEILIYKVLLIQNTRLMFHQPNPPENLNGFQLIQLDFPVELFGTLPLVFQRDKLK